jgi:serine/threonine protein kinase/Tol biopolymer transport system component
MTRASIPAGTTVSPRYRIEGFLGAGGMAEVYAARDLQLDRTVALKVLSPERASDPARMQRFVREAQLASSLNHPAIIAVHDAGAFDGIHYLAMELIDGQTLDLWSRSVRDQEKLLEIFIAVADGLARAHADGIVHRDLKPQNVIVSRGGHPKILDFGVAKLTDREPANNGSDTAPVQAMGTAAYMSPEQVEGLPVDHRSDIFSFGALMYQALTGKSPFDRQTAIESMHAVMHDEAAPLSDVRPGLRRIVRKCLIKDRDFRYQSIKDVALDLRELRRDEQPAAVKPRRRGVWTAVAGLAVLALSAPLIVNLSRAQPRTRVPVTQPSLPEPVMLRMTNSGNITAGAISPDGNYIVHATMDGENQTMWVKQVATGTNVRILPPDRVYYADFRVSPDGNYVFYSVAHRDEPNVIDLRIVPMLGGQSRLVAPNMEGNFAISPDGKKAAFLRFNAYERLWRLETAVVDTGEEATLVKRPYPGFIGSLSWTPNGKTITFVSAREGSKLKPGLFNIDVATGAISPVHSPDWPGIGSIAWLPDGSGLLVSASDRQQPRQIWFLPKGSKHARKITSDISKFGSLSVTADSRSIAAHRSDFTANLWLADARGTTKPRPLTTGLGNCFGTGGVRWLPDGRILYTVCGPGVNALNVMDVSRAESHELTRGFAYWHPYPSPDGRKLAVVSDRSGREEIWIMNANAGEAKQLTNQGPVSFPTWMPDSQSIVYLTRGPQQAVWRAWLDGRTEKLLERPTFYPMVSPDGKWLLCRLRQPDSKATPLWRTALVPLETKGEPRYLPIPRHGSPGRAQWFGDAQRFAFLDYSGGVSNVWLSDLRLNAPRQVTQFDSGMICAYDVSKDGQSIVISHEEFVNDVVIIRDFR